MARTVAALVGFAAATAVIAPPASAHHDCAHVCRVSGTCSPTNGRCVATTNQDCKRSTGCSEFGRCVAKDEVCIVERTADCRKSSVCAHFGRCSAVQNVCVVARAADCGKSVACVHWGRCGFKKSGSTGRCVLTKAGCKKSKPCKAEGLCKLADSACIATAGSCAKAKRCKAFGHCGAVKGVCAPTRHKHCKSSHACKASGACVLIALSECRPGDPLCSDIDREDGIRCGATIDDNCKSSVACKNHGRCRAFHGECVK